MLFNGHNITDRVNFSEGISGYVLGHNEAVLWRERPVVIATGDQC